MNRWHLQVCEREWVEWWYGPLQPGARGHLDPAITYVADMELPFTLPEHRSDGVLKPPQEIRRFTSWGWRARTNDYIHDSGWYIAESRDACIMAATAKIAGPDSDVYAQAVQDVREYKTGLW
jgi:hypothetical protein